MQLDVVSPQGKAYSEEIAKVSVPGADGQLTILPDHTSLFAKLVDGELKITAIKKEEIIYMAIGGGFIEVKDNNIVVLVTRAVHQDELDEKEISEAIKKAERLIKEAPTDKDRQAAASLLHARLTDLKIIRRRSKLRSRSQRQQL
jgi:F-type H+-transporting ATPase subunit epsilon